MVQGPRKANLKIMDVRRRGGTRRAFPPLEIGPKNQTFLEIMKSAAPFWLTDLILAMTAYLPVRHTLHKSQVHGHGVMQ